MGVYIGGRFIKDAYVHTPIFLKLWSVNDRLPSFVFECQVDF